MFGLLVIHLFNDV